MLEQVIDLVKNVGFPIAVTIYLLIRQDRERMECAARMTLLERRLWQLARPDMKGDPPP